MLSAPAGPEPSITCVAITAFDSRGVTVGEDNDEPRHGLNRIRIRTHPGFTLLADFVLSSISFERSIPVPKRCDLVQVCGQKGRNRPREFVLVDMPQLMRQQSTPSVPSHIKNRVAQCQTDHTRPQKAGIECNGPQRWIVSIRLRPELFQGSPHPLPERRRYLFLRQGGASREHHL